MKHKIFYITSDSFMDIQDEDKVSSELQSVFFSNHLCSVFSVYHLHSFNQEGLFAFCVQQQWLHLPNQIHSGM